MAGDMEQRKAPVSVEVIPGGTERVLVVEDDAVLRESITLQLRGLGYAVFAAADACAALTALEAQQREAKQRIELLLIDMVLPGKRDGLALAEEAARRFPPLPAVFMSGYGMQAPAYPDGTRPKTLRKPFRKSELAGAVRRALDKARTQ
jgi:CheY-like chemotaxis protein